MQNTNSVYPPIFILFITNAVSEQSLGVYCTTHKLICTVHKFILITETMFIFKVVKISCDFWHVHNLKIVVILCVLNKENGFLSLKKFFFLYKIKMFFHSFKYFPIFQHIIWYIVE